MGATNASMNFMQVKMFKEVRNQVNRKTNFETANIDKTVSASAKQIAAIETIIHSVGLQQLPLDLQELASLRYENPEMSLRELGEQLSEPISRSGVNHRLKRIMAFADSIGKKELKSHSFITCCRCWKGGSNVRFCTFAFAYRI